MAPIIRVVFDKTRQVSEGLKHLGDNRVLVGVPETKTERKDAEENNTVTNAMIGYWNEKGAPEANLPARPHLVPGVKSVQKLSIAMLRQASIYALMGRPQDVSIQLNKIGQINRDAVKKKILDGLSPPLSPKTIAARHKGRGTSSQRKSEKKYLELLDEGATAQEAQDATGLIPLINSSQYLRSITYVIRRV